MVAYSFKSQFAAPIRDGVKCQTVRGQRGRHARVGEMMQLYTGMRTKACVKIMPDVVCVAVHEIEIVTSAMIDEVIVSIAVNGIPLNRIDIEAFAECDGFAAWPNYTARHAMGNFWLENHGKGRFEGVLILWEWRT